MSTGLIVVKRIEQEGVRVPEGAVFKNYTRRRDGFYYVPEYECRRGGVYGKSGYIAILFNDREVEEFEVH